MSCQNCSNRYRACHDTCPIYNSEKKIKEKKKAEIIEQKKLNNSFFESIYRCKNLRKGGNFIAAIGK